MKSLWDLWENNHSWLVDNKFKSQADTFKLDFALCKNEVRSPRNTLFPQETELGTYVLHPGSSISKGDP